MGFGLCALLFIAVPVAGYPNGYVGGIEREPLQPLMHKGVDTSIQLQPENYDNYQHGMQYFFQHELLYVENDMVLVWTPSTGEWRLHEVRRECGKDCPILAERPLKAGVWPERRMHKLIFLGCHPQTGHGHMLQIEPQSGNYTVYMFEHDKADPLTERLAFHRRLEMTQYQITYVGKDEIVMYDGNTGQYKIYLVEPRLPMYLDEDPIGPFEALDIGNFSFHEQLIYLGDNHILDHSAFSGEYFVHRYDRGATYNETSFTGVLASGTVDRFMQLTYIANKQVIGWYPNNGSIKAFNLTDDFQLTPLSEGGVYYGFGTIMLGEMCSALTDCKSCIAREGCGWCDTIHECFRGQLEGPCHTNCTDWELTLCPGEPCHTHRDCSECLHDPFCGWCADSDTCVEGTTAGPLFGSCDFSKLFCPIFQRNEDEEVRCTEEIE